MSDKQEVFKDIPRPLGEFILSQKDIGYYKCLDGAWFHYKDVCTLLQRYAASQPPAVKGAVWVKASDFKYSPFKILFARIGLHKGTGHFDKEGAFFWEDGGETLEHHYHNLYILDESGESPTAAGDILLIDRDWLHEILIEHIMIYKRNPLGVDANDVAEYLDDKLKGKGVYYMLDENERLTAAGEVAKELELAKSHFKLKSEQVGYWSQAYHALKAALLKLRKGANSVDLAIIDEALNREIKATAAGDGKARETIEDILLKTGKHNPEKCSEIADAILRDIKGAGDGKEEKYDELYCLVYSNLAKLRARTQHEDRLVAKHSEIRAIIEDVTKQMQAMPQPEPTPSPFQPFETNSMSYRGPGSHCKACEDEAAGIKHITAAKHTCRKQQNK